ncbi:MAG: hypothetical protein AAF526_08600 [Pseudomonadota bacterium]
MHFEVAFHAAALLALPSGLNPGGSINIFDDYCPAIAASKNHNAEAVSVHTLL